MRQLALVGSLVGLLALTPPAHATDAETFENFIDRLAPSLADLVNDVISFRPRVACVCKTDGQPGLLARFVGTSVFCFKPAFNAAGKFLGGTGCDDNAYEVISKP